MKMADWILRITYCDENNNRFLTLGGAAWNTKRERDANLAKIPVATHDTNLVLDIMSPRGTEDDRLIDPKTVERLLGRPIAELIRKAGEAEDGAHV